MKSRNLIFYLIITLIIIGVSCEKDDLHTPELLMDDPVLKDDCDYIIVIGDTQVYTNEINTIHIMRPPWIGFGHNVKWKEY